MQTQESNTSRLVTRALLGAVVVCALCGGAARAQQQTEANTDVLEVLPPTLNIQEQQPHEGDDSSLLIRKLLDEVKQSRARLRQSEDNVLPPAEIDQLKLDDDQTRVFSDIDDQIRNWDNDRKQRVSIIQMKVRQLSELLKKRAQQKAEPAPKTEKPATHSTTEAPKNTATADTPENAPPATVPAEEKQPEEVPPEEPLPQPITDSAVDHLALADNLFGAGKTKLALGVYQNIKADELTDEEQGWVLYQIGVCHRKLGDTSAAEKQLRVVAGMTSLPRLPQFARWQLDAIARLKELKARAEKTKSTIDSVKAQLDQQAS